MLRALCPVLLAAFLTSGCIIDDDDPVVVSRGNGLLTVTWTVTGTDDPDACAFEGADAIDIYVERSRGGTAAHVGDACEAFVTSVELPPGTYVGDAVLTDPGGHTITTAADLGYFDIYGGDEVIVDVDFPPSSFY
jgi:hypothetical protein